MTNFQIKSPHYNGGAETMVMMTKLDPLSLQIKEAQNITPKHTHTDRHTHTHKKQQNNNNKFNQMLHTVQC